MRSIPGRARRRRWPRSARCSPGPARSPRRWRPPRRRSPAAGWSRGSHRRGARSTGWRSPRAGGSTPCSPRSTGPPTRPPRPCPRWKRPAPSSTSTRASWTGRRSGCSRSRAAARRHSTSVDLLPDLRASFAARLAALEDGGAGLARLTREEAAARAAYLRAATALSEGRAKAAAKLDKAVAAELPALKLEKAVFRDPARNARRAAMVRARDGARALRGRDQPRRGAGPDRAHRLGRRAVPLPAGAARSCWPRRARCRRWCSTRSMPASAARPRRRSASAWRGSGATCRCWSSPIRPRSRPAARMHWRVVKGAAKGGSRHPRRGARRGDAARGDRPHAGRRDASPTRRAPPPPA